MSVSTFAHHRRRLIWNWQEFAARHCLRLRKTSCHSFSASTNCRRAALSFPEEPLGIPASKGYGYAELDFGERIGPENRYEILRKLGWGSYSSVWLAKDVLKDSYVAIKVLKGDSTSLHESGFFRELDVLKAITQSESDTSTTHCIRLLDDFKFKGRNRDGMHLSFVTEVLGPTVAHMRKELDEPLPIPLVKRMCRHILLGLARLHDKGIAHTDLRPENIMTRSHFTSSHSIRELLERDLPRRYPPQKSWNANKVEVAVSQPLQIPIETEKLMEVEFVIGDVGNAEFLRNKTTDMISPEDLRAPEVVLGLPWDEHVDIWSFGCLVYEFITDRRLFLGKEGVDANMLRIFQAYSITGEAYSPQTIAWSEKAKKIVDEKTGRIKDSRLTRVSPVDMQQLVKLFAGSERSQMAAGCVDLIKSCLHVNPGQRRSARELLKHPWVTQE